MHAYIIIAAKVIKGQKLIYQKWFYQKPIMPSSREKVCLQNFIFIV